MFDRALNTLMCIGCLLNGKKKKKIRLGKLIDAPYRKNYIGGIP